uniref:probable G-protein coupled receptor 34 n=1 Tax=Podarcis muralis TaxID=64176 RepID=UPI00109F145D|nr:probable G-protein coupled receptor 34 [Podarcis muralis]XP_028570028.1 probable G-protein coupled receptor 34 [Podarcis muralis]XP_028570029.1 probable G-protein coupled receptor 34 [Podarcis muralis]XP_028570030.1 probable G-protein coupled receptor 34 [Podarcis muralis]XP_028570031.1 probable G-protein coupled receptor 34 [Podarcis muralis]
MNFLSPNDHLPRNDSNGSTCEIQDGFLAGTLPVMYSVISTFGFFSNMLALWVFQFGTQKTNSITVYMKNLAISDLLLALCLPFRAAYQNENGPPILCKVVGTVFYTTMYISILLLSLICLDRYLKIIWPLQQFRIHKVPHSTSASRVVWLLCIAIMLPYFFNKGNSNDPCSHKCFHFKKRGALAAVLNMTAVLLFFFLLLFFLYSYCKISLKLHTASLRKSKRISSRATLKISVVLLVFTICFAPYHMVRVPYIFAQVGVFSAAESVQALHFANEVVLCISALNCCFDPIIFFFLSSNFKRALLAATLGKLKRALQKNPDMSGNRKSITDSRMQES